MHVGLEGYLVGGWGQVALGVQLRTAPWYSSPISGGNQGCVRLEMLTTYERLRSFAEELEAVVHGRWDLARVEGERVG